MQRPNAATTARTSRAAGPSSIVMQTHTGELARNIPMPFAARLIHALTPAGIRICKQAKALGSKWRVLPQDRQGLAHPKLCLPPARGSAQLEPEGLSTLAACWLAVHCSCMQWMGPQGIIQAPSIITLNPGDCILLGEDNLINGLRFSQGQTTPWATGYLTN